MLEQGVAPSITTLPVIVDYSLSRRRMINAGRYKNVHLPLFFKKLPFVQRESGTLKAHLVCFNCRSSSEQALEALDKAGLRPGEFPELCAVGAQYPDEHMKKTIIALGSVGKDWLGKQCVAGLVMHSVLPISEAGRALGMGPFKRTWRAGVCFLAFPKSL